jgi:hypothetical protein
VSSFNFQATAVGHAYTSRALAASQIGLLPGLIAFIKSGTDARVGEMAEGVAAVLLIVVDHLRRRFTRFKLCSHFLDLRRLFVETHNQTFSVAAMRVCNEDRSPVGINR